MRDTRWRKVLRDVWLHQARTMLVVVAITAGLVGAGSILNTWALVKRVTRESFIASNPASATLRTDSIDTALLQLVRALPGIRDAQARRTIRANVRGPAGWMSAMFFAVEDFSDVRIGRVKADGGAWPPAEGELVIERSSLGISGASVGEPVAVAIGRAEPVPLTVTGIARDVGLAPGWMEHLVYGFVSRATLDRLGVPSSLDELQIVVSDGTLDQDGVRQVAWTVKDAVEATGRRVHDVDVPVPGRHIHAAQMDSLLYTQGAFAALALLLSCFLVVNLISAMLAGQVREIGVMKSLGARAGQIAGLYLGLALVLGLLASALSLPVAAWIGYRYAALKAELLNFDTGGYAIPFGVIALQFAVGALLPVVAAALPVIRGCRISVGDALRDVGMDRHGPPGALMRRTGGVARPVLLSLRNAFRRRQRMAITLLTLATGGAVYLGALNLRASIRAAVDRVYEPMRFQLTIRFAQPWPSESLETLMRGVAGVSAAETFAAARAVVSREGGTVGNVFAISAPAANSAMLSYPVVEGRWLRAGDSNALVVTRGFQQDEPGVVVGGRVKLMIGGRPTDWTVVGAVRAGPGQAAFAPREAVAAVASGGLVDRAMIRADAGMDPDLIQRLRAELERRGFQVQGSQLLAESRRILEDHMLLVAEFLGVMAWVMIVVGGLGLASTMSLAVLERTREIGVMRAIGASHRAIHAMVQTEGLVIAGLSWLIAIPLSVPMSVILGRAFGRIMLPVPVILVPEASGVVWWLAVVVVVSVIGCAWPAVRATRVTAAAALAYE